MMWATALFMVMAHVIKHTFRKQAQYEDVYKRSRYQDERKPWEFQGFLNIHDQPSTLADELALSVAQTIILIHVI